LLDTSWAALLRTPSAAFDDNAEPIIPALALPSRASCRPWLFELSVDSAVYYSENFLADDFLQVNVFFLCRKKGLPACKKFYPQMTQIDSD